MAKSTGQETASMHSRHMGAEAAKKRGERALLAHSVVNATGQTEAAFRDSERAHVGVAASTNFMCAWGSEPPLDDNTALR